MKGKLGDGKRLVNGNPAKRKLNKKFVMTVSPGTTKPVNCSLKSCEVRIRGDASAVEVDHRIAESLGWSENKISCTLRFRGSALELLNWRI